jgi:hypothetical protein
MALRFRKSIKLAPGIRWNLSMSGSSWTLGPRGASIGIGKRGTYLNTGIPGTGLSFRSTLGPVEAPRERALTQTTTFAMTCSLEDDGALAFKDAAGNDMPERLVELAKKQNRDAILGLIQRKCDEINHQVEALGRLHHDTPDPRVKPRFFDAEHPIPTPSEPAPRAVRIFDRLVPGKVRAIEEANRDAAAVHRNDLAEWRQQKLQFDKGRKERKKLIESRIYCEVSSMESFLEERLQEIVWPRETIVTVDIRDGGAVVVLDVDLPEIEDMPAKVAAVPARGLKLSIKDMPASKVQRLYADHVHGIVFRLLGEVFAALPVAQAVTVSGYSQRSDKATGKVEDQYVLSAAVMRPAWEEIDFNATPQIDVAQALARFDLRRDITRTGLLKPIQPH